VAATYVTEAELRSNLGIGTLYSSPTVEEVCQTAQDLINQYLWFNRVPVVSSGLTSNVATLVVASPGIFVIGQTVTISACGSPYNGTRVITGTGPYTITSNNLFMGFPYNDPRVYSFLQFAITGSNEAQHLIQPYGNMLGPEHKTDAYANTPAIREAAMMLAVDVWQARQVSQTGGVSVDGLSANPYRMGNNLMGKIRGLLAPYSSPSAMVG
jgi:hypothetical protein